MTAPNYIVVGDALKIPVVIQNFGTAVFAATVTETAADPTIKVVLPAKFNVAVNTIVTTYITVTGVTPNTAAQVSLTVSGLMNKITYSAVQQASIPVLPNNGQIFKQSMGGVIGSVAKTTTGPSSASLALTTPASASSTSIGYDLAFYPSALSLIESFRQALGNAPQSNFEQVSSQYYALNLRLNALKAAT